MRYRHPRPNCRTHPERFIWPKVDQSGGDDGCWLWQGCLSTNGYGRVGKRDYVHRVVAELHHGPCPDGQEVNALTHRALLDHLDTLVDNLIRERDELGARVHQLETAHQPTTKGA